MSAGHLQHDVLKELHGGSLSRRVPGTVVCMHRLSHCMHVHASDLGASAQMDAARVTASKGVHDPLASIRDPRSGACAASCMAGIGPYEQAITLLALNM